LPLRYPSPSRKVHAVKSVRCSESARPGFSVAGDFSRVSHRGKFGTCPACRCPGFAASSEILLPRRMETPNPNPGAQASGEHRCIALLRVQLRDDLSPWRKTAVRNVRDNNAARVAGPGRICFPPVTHPPDCPAGAHPSAHFAEGWDSTVPSLLGLS